MKRSRFTEEQIAYALRQAEAGTPVADVCRQLGVSEATFYVWKKKFANLGVTELRKLRMLEEENARLKRVVADLTLDRHILQEVLRKNVWSAPPIARFLASDEGSPHKCIRPLASGLRLQPGHDEIRAQRSSDKWFGQEPVFLHRLTLRRSTVSSSS